MDVHPHRALSRDEQSRLRHLVERIERDTGAEVAVLIVPHVDDPEAFATAYFNSIGIGKRGRDDGILILVVVDRRVVRIEVGRGLEQRVTREAAHRVITDVMAPQLRLGRYGEAVLRGADAVGHLVGAAAVRHA